MDASEEWPVEDNELRRSVCESFSAQVMSVRRQGGGEQIFVDSESSRSIWELIYNVDNRGKDLLDEDSGFNWIHMDANNRIWTEDLVKVLQGPQIVAANPEISRFINDSYSENFQIFDLGNRQTMLSFSMPCFDSESYSYLYRHDLDRAVEHNPRAYENFTPLQALEEAYELNVDTSKSLDSYICTVPVPPGVQELWDRDQVVYRYSSALSESSLDHSKTKILMVNQLRLWIVGNTVITSYPRRWTHAPRTLMDFIRDRARHSVPFGTRMELVMFLLRGCIDALEEPYRAGLHGKLLDIFSAEIAGQAIKQLQNFDDFTQVSTTASEEMRGIVTRKLISEEIETYRLIVDIRDELSMIQQVLGEQVSISSHFEAGLGAVMFKLEGRFKDLDRRAERVESSLKHSVDLKLKQSSLDEARDSNIQAREARKQSSILFAFTVITVLFSPLSFVAAFFAIPSQSFPFDNDRNVVNWSRHQIGIGLGVGVLIVAIPCIMLWVWATRKYPDDPPFQLTKNDKHDIHWNASKPPNPKGKGKTVASGVIASGVLAGNNFGTKQRNNVSRLRGLGFRRGGRRGGHPERDDMNDKTETMDTGVV